jgi:putative FmdB family regulatory protein
MPTYEYKCEQCGHRFEAVQSMKDQALSACPKCQGAVSRMISRNVLISFKGSGFYVTDSATKAKVNAEASPSKASS